MIKIDFNNELPIDRTHLASAFKSAFLIAKEVGMVPVDIQMYIGADVQHDIIALDKNEGLRALYDDNGMFGSQLFGVPLHAVSYKNGLTVTFNLSDRPERSTL